MGVLVRPISLVAVVLLSAGVSNGQLISDSFDSQTTGRELAWEWWNNGSSGNVTVDEVTYRGAFGKSVKLTRTSFDGLGFGFGRNFPPLDGPAELTFFFLVESTDQQMLSAIGGNNAAHQVAWWIGVGGAIGSAIATHSVVDGWNHVMDVLPNTWYGVTLEIEPSAHTYNITVWEDGNPGNTATESGIAFRNGSDVDVIDQIQFGNFTDATESVTDGAFVDDVTFVGSRVLSDGFESGNTGSWSTSTRPLTTITSCYQTVTTDARLGNDLNCDSGGFESVAIEIGASDITLDLNGHTISGHPIGIGVRAINFDRVTVKNGVLQDFMVGVDLVNSDVATVTNLKISNLVEDDPEIFLPGLRITASHNVLVRDSFIEFLPVVHKEAIVTPDSVVTVDNVEVKDASVGVNIAGNEGISNGTIATVINSRFVHVNIGGILVQMTDNSRIANNEFDHNEIGVYCDSMWEDRVTGLTVEDNSMHHGFIGVLFLGTEDSYVLDNSLHDNNGGVVLESNMECLDDTTRPDCFYATGNVISGNVALDNFMDLRHDDHATGNIWTDNICQTKEGAEIPPCTGLPSP